ncbi:MAG TPA: DHHA1 domain-containing protein, partial [Candidatus Caenarcaniphilales bacterium]
SGDCRYLAQRGIQRLQQQRALKTRPGVARLLELCQRSGDRPTDISFGIGPRINAVSRIQGDARFCVELLTSHDVQLCDQLAAETELANARRKSLQKEVAQQVEQKLKQLDLSTTSVIVLADDQWPTGVLGLVAAQVAEEQGRPTILLSTDCLDLDSRSGTQALARGSARSVNQVDLYQLVKAQAHLLHRFGGHPFAAGLSLPVENITLFSEAINQQFRQDYSVLSPTALNVQADLIVTVAELVADLGKTLFQELKLLEPCGMGNPVPKLLIYNCWFDNARHRNIHDAKGHKLRYIKTQFTVRDDTTPHGFPGVWWGHYRDDIPPGRCDAVVELDHNSYADKSTRQKPHYEVRLVAVWPSENNGCRGAQIASSQGDEILSWRRRGKPELSGQTPVLVDQGLLNNSGLPGWQPPLDTGKTGAIADPASEPPQQWHQLVGIAKYLHRTEGSTTCRQLQEKLGITQLCLDLGLQALKVV